MLHTVDVVQFNSDDYTSDLEFYLNRIDKVLLLEKCQLKVLKAPQV